MAPVSTPWSVRLLGWSAFSLLLASTTQAASPAVKVNGTNIVGSSQAVGGLIGVDFFGGIPFAKPPLGDLRFAPPVEIDSLGVPTFNATEFGAPCVQFNLTGVSEDCLTLNIYRPSEALLPTNASVPVLFWIYGGGFLEGETSIYDATEIIVQSVLRGTPIVYVSVNYRVGPFGFPQGTEAAQLGALNVGLKDQLAGLSWVQKHIRAFGGDPTKVTIFGQSAGSISIAQLYLNSGLEKYGVRGAIFESGSAGSLPIFDASRREVVWDSFVGNTTACTDATAGATFGCLRNATTSDLLSSWETIAALFPEPFLFSPVIDGPNGIIPDLPSKLLAAGHFSKIPFIAGTVLDEGTDFVPQSISSEQELIEFLVISDNPFNPTLSTKFQQDIATLLQLYPDIPALGSPFGTGNETFGLSSEYKRASALLGDASFQAPRREWIQTAAAAGVTTYGYIFTDQHAAAADPAAGVQHASEIPYVYGDPTVTESNMGVGVLATSMTHYWISFAVSGTPNDGKGLPRTAWPQYQPNNQVLIQFDTTNLTSDLSKATFAIIPDTYRAQQISFINSISADLGE
ncbi:extracellular triacylglycerol lipase precursor [Dichomitus squalens]|uniref:Carboxylic ester hydrolase n=1 Tax=Dichomitus squalens TaxID=114155 RepID=A0A4Q9MPK2_9APHY|nr:extracellular triacylglycerol lipase precursor [Dichomitus squalens]